MNEERIRILKMLEESKITVDEAMRLIESLDRPEPDIEAVTVQAQPSVEYGQKIENEEDEEQPAPRRQGKGLKLQKLSGAFLGGAQLQGAKLDGINFSGAYLGDADLRDADLSGANLSGANLANANLRGANLRDANLSGAFLEGVDFEEADLEGANFSGCHLPGLKFRNGGFQLA